MQRSGLQTKLQAKAVQTKLQAKTVAAWRGKRGRKWVGARVTQGGGGWGGEAAGAAGG
jgi:hypothetical protein